MQSTEKNLVRDCPFCGTNNQERTATNFGDANWPIKVCSDCNFVYIETVPIYERLSEEFAWEKTSVAETERRLANEPMRQSISALLKRIRQKWLKRDKLGFLIRRHFTAGNVLDIGCAEGGILKRLDATYIPFGIEISKALASQANIVAQAGGGYVIHADALAGSARFPADHFSGIVMSAFLEHETQPKALLAQAFRSLKNGGHCIIKVPNFASFNRVVRGPKWCGIRLPDHVNYFTPTNLAGMCSNAGFRIKQFSIVDRLPTSDNMWIVIQKPEL